MFVCLKCLTGGGAFSGLGLLGTGPFRDTFHQSGPFGDSLLGLLGTLFLSRKGPVNCPQKAHLMSRDWKTVPKGPSKVSPKGPVNCPQKAHLGTGPFGDSFGSHINFLSKVSPKGPLGYWAFWGHFLDPRFIRWISALSERNDKSDVVGFA